MVELGFDVPMGVVGGLAGFQRVGVVSMTDEQREKMTRVLDLLVDSGCLSGYQLHSSGSALVRMDDHELAGIISQIIRLSEADPEAARLIAAALAPSLDTPAEDDNLALFRTFLHAAETASHVQSAVSKPESDDDF
jgi:hypothetical protein